MLSSHFDLCTLWKPCHESFIFVPYSLNHPLGMNYSNTIITIKTTSNQSNAPFNTGSTNRQFTWSPDGLDSPSSWDSSFYASIYSKAFSLSPTAWEFSSSTTLLPFSAPSTNHRGSTTVYPCPRATNKNSDPLPDDCPNSNFGSPVRGGVSRVSV